MRWLLIAGLFAVQTAAVSAQISPAQIPQQPDILGDMVVYSAEGDLWLGDLKTNKATRLTSWPGTEGFPKFSPDGSHIAFSGNYDGRLEVYVMPTTGGTPSRITYDSTGATILDWLPDGKSVVYRTRGSSSMGEMRLLRAPIEGGIPIPYPMPKAAQFSVNLDGSKIAYVKTGLEDHWWKRYRGGMANDIWLYEPKRGAFSRLTKNEINEQYPTFCGNSLFFVSEKNGSANLFSLNTETGAEKQVTFQKDYDIQSPSSDGKRIVYRFGQNLEIFDPAKGTTQTVKLSVSTDRIHARAHRIGGDLEAYSPGPTGKRILVECRGQIFSAPADKGDIREVAAWPGSRNKLAAWAPNNSSIAFVSDKSDEENVWLVNPDGGEPRQLTQFKSKSIQRIQWSPNSAFLLVSDATRTLWKVDAKTGETTKIFEDEYGMDVSGSVSVDGRFIAYSKSEAFNQSSIFLLDSATGKTHRLTEPPTRDYNPVFDRSNRYLYFLTDRVIRPQWDSFDFQMNITGPTRIMFFPLTKEALNPFAERVDEEGQSDPTPSPTVTYDLEGASNRLLSIPGVVGDLYNLSAVSGTIFWQQDGALKSFTLEGKRPGTVAEGVSGYKLTPDGNKIVAQIEGELKVGSTEGGFGGPAVNLSSWQVRVEPEKEWRQILREGWRFIRDNFYDPNLHGADWPKVWEKLSALLPAVSDRNDLNDLVGQMQAEVNVSHMFNGGGYERMTAPPQPGGLGYLGADMAWEGGGLRFKRIFAGDGFEESSRSPLMNPEIGVKEGDYLLAINDVPITRVSNPNELLMGKAGQLVKLKVNSKPTGDGARSFWVRTMRSEQSARYYDWVTRNRQYVQKEGGSNIAYIHVPDMGEFGMTEFSKYFYANLDKDGLIIDVRYNGGGITSGMILERLKRVAFEWDQSRQGAPVPYHRMAFNSRVVIVTNEQTASDGEYFSTGFRYMQLGKSIGARTWGGFVAVGGMTTIDGGYISCPLQGSFDPKGKWLPDGYGFKPDIEVDDDPVSFMQGRDVQLDKAIEVLQAEIRKAPVMKVKRLTPPKKG